MGLRDAADAAAASPEEEESLTVGSIDSGAAAAPLASSEPFEQRLFASLAELERKIDALAEQGRRPSVGAGGGAAVGAGGGGEAPFAAIPRQGSRNAFGLGSCAKARVVLEPVGHVSPPAKINLEDKVVSLTLEGSPPLLPGACEEEEEPARPLQRAVQAMAVPESRLDCGDSDSVHLSREGAAAAVASGTKTGEAPRWADMPRSASSVSSRARVSTSKWDDSSVNDESPKGKVRKWASWVFNSHKLEEAAGPVPTSWNLVHSGKFQLVCSMVILLNAIFIGYSAGAALSEVAYGKEVPAWTETVETCFVVFFTGELLARMYCERFHFLVGIEWRWNLFDSILVGLSLLDAVLNQSGHGGDLVGYTVGRLLRLARFFRLMRITRVVRNMYSLRLVVFTILDTMGSLFFSFLVIGFIIYIFAVLLVHGAAEHFQGLTPHQISMDPNAQQLLKWYGGIPETMISLFMAISGGADWSDILEPLRDIHPVYLPVFIGYIFFMYFGVLNVVIGAFVSATSETAAKDREHMVKDELARMDSYVRKIKTFFYEADTDRSGTLSWEELTVHLQNTKVKAYFQALELDVSQAHVLFDLLDADGSDSVTIDEFLDGCLRLKGQARSIDINLLLFRSQKNMEHVKEFFVWTKRELKRLRSIAVDPTTGLGAKQKQKQEQRQHRGCGEGTSDAAHGASDTVRMTGWAQQVDEGETV